MIARCSENSIRLSWAALTCALLLLTPTTGLGQGSGGDKEKAKQYYQRGMQQFYKKNYAMAITNFKHAHSIDPSGTLLYNISIAYSRMGNPGDAMKFSEKAAQRDDLPEDTVVKNDARMAAYTVAMTSREAVGADKPATSSAPTGGSAGGSTSRGSSPPPTDTSGNSGGGGGGHALAWTGGGLALTGAGLVGGAVYLNMQVRDKIVAKRDAEDAENLEKANRLYNQIDSQQTLGQIFIYAGSGAMALGTTLLIIDLASSGSQNARAVRVTGGPSSNGWSVGLDVSF